MLFIKFGNVTHFASATWHENFLHLTHTSRFVSQHQLSPPLRYVFPPLLSPTFLWWSHLSSSARRLHVRTTAWSNVNDWASTSNIAEFFVFCYVCFCLSPFANVLSTALGNVNIKFAPVVLHHAGTSGKGVGFIPWWVRGFSTGDDKRQGIAPSHRHVFPHFPLSSSILIVY
jgi:hypothetical protein